MIVQVLYHDYPQRLPHAMDHFLQVFLETTDAYQSCHLYRMRLITDSVMAHQIKTYNPTHPQDTPVAYQDHHSNTHLPQRNFLLYMHACQITNS